MKQIPRAVCHQFVREQIYLYRVSHHLSQESIAEKIQVSPRSYIDQEHGQMGFSLRTFLAFTELLDEADICRLFQSFRTQLDLQSECKDGYSPADSQPKTGFPHTG